MNNDTLLILGAAVAVGIGVWGLSKPLGNITEGAGDAVSSVGASVQTISSTFSEQGLGIIVPDWLESRVNEWLGRLTA